MEPRTYKVTKIDGDYAHLPYYKIQPFDYSFKRFHAKIFRDNTIII